MKKAMITSFLVVVCVVFISLPARGVEPEKISVVAPLKTALGWNISGICYGALTSGDKKEFFLRCGIAKDANFNFDFFVRSSEDVDYSDARFGFAISVPH